MISYVITCVEYGSKRDFSGLAWIIKYMEQNVILKWFSVRKIKEKIQKFRFFFKDWHRVRYTFFKKAPNFEIIWPTPATPRALTVKGKLMGACVHLWFQKWFQQQYSKHRWRVRRCELVAKGAVHVLLGIWNQNSNTVIYEKCCSYLSISIFIDWVQIYQRHQIKDNNYYQPMHFPELNFQEAGIYPLKFIFGQENM